MADVFLGGSFFHSFSCCLRSIIVVRSFRWTQLIFDVGEESVYLLGVTCLRLFSLKLVALSLLVFFPHTSIHVSSSEPPRSLLLLVVPLSLSLPLLLSSDMLLANPPISEEYSCRRLNLIPNSLQILLGCHPLYFLL